MYILTILSLAIISRLGIRQNQTSENQFFTLKEVLECPKECMEGDYSISWRECKEQTIWDTFWNANAETVCKERPPLVAKKCEGCSKAVTADDFNQVCENCGSQFEISVALMKNVDCWKIIQNFDSEGNRMVFRHTGNEIKVEEFFRLFQTGARSAYTLYGCPGSQ